MSVESCLNRKPSGIITNKEEKAWAARSGKCELKIPNNCLSYTVIFSYKNSVNYPMFFSTNLAIF